MTLPTNFQPYLQAILTNAEENTRQDWLDFYTPTQVEVPLCIQDIYQSSSFNAQRPRQKGKQEKKEILKTLLKHAPKHVLLVGKPGSGKSIALKRLLWEEAKRWETGKSLWNQSKIPVLVKLREYRNCSVLDLLKKSLHKLELSKNEIKALLLEQKLLLLFDGLNELPSNDAWREIASFREEYADTPMIFTTRELGAGADLEIEKKLEMLPLSTYQIRQFVNKRLSESADYLLQQITGRLWELTETPLLLEMLCDVFAQKSQIPKNRGELFRVFARHYDEFKSPRTLPISDNFRRLAPKLLQELAFEMIQGNSSVEFRLQISKLEAEEKLEAFLKTCGETSSASKAREYLEDLLKYYLLQVANNSDEIEFKHQLFQEYYAAEKLLVMLRAKHPDFTEKKRWQYHYLNYLKWTECIALMLTLPELTSDQALRLVKDALDVDLMLGAKLAGAVKPELQKQTVKLITELEIPGRIEIGFTSFPNSIKLPPIIKSELLRITNSEYVIPGFIDVFDEFGKDLIAQEYQIVYAEIAALGLAELENKIAMQALVKIAADINRFRRPFRISVINAIAKLANFGSKSAIQTLTAIQAQVDKLEERWLSEHISSVLDISELDDLENEEYTQALKELENLPLSTHEEVVNQRKNYIRHTIVEFVENIIFKSLKLINPGLTAKSKYAIVFFQKTVIMIPRLLSLFVEIQCHRTKQLWRIRKLALELEKNSTHYNYSETDKAVPNLLIKLWDLDFSGFGEREIRQKAADELGNLDSEVAIPVLLKELEFLAKNTMVIRSEDFDLEIGILKEIASPKSLSGLWQVQLTGKIYLSSTIRAIQAHCMFYNYNIFQSTPPLPIQPTYSNVSANLHIMSPGEVTIMAEKPQISFNQQQATIGVAYAAEGSIQEFTQYNNATEQSFEVLLTDFKQFINDLQQEFPTATDTTVLHIINLKAQEIQRTQPLRWQNFLNLKRICNGSKKATIKVGEHFTEQNPWGKGAIAFLEGVMEDPK